MVLQSATYLFVIELMFLCAQNDNRSERKMSKIMDNAVAKISIGGNVGLCGAIIHCKRI